MPKYGKNSQKRKSQLHPDLQRIAEELIKEYDCSILCGTRGREEQERAFNDGNSKARFGQSPHNYEPSFAMDVVPYPCDWNDIPEFKKMVSKIKRIAKKLNIEITCGADFKSFKDYPHIELKNWKELSKNIKKKEKNREMIGSAIIGKMVLGKVLGFAKEKIKDKIADKVGKETLSKIQEFTGLDLNTAKEDELEKAIENLPPEQIAEIKKEALKADVSIEREITKRNSEVNKTYRKELDSDIQFVAMARPFNLYALAVAMFLLVVGGLTLCFMGMAKQFQVFVDSLNFPLTAWVGVVGVYVNGKSKEKIKTNK